ncbi:MAG: helicase-exonuclease AddAB subunit AddA [Lachnospiraceae bacterium]
MSINMIRGVIFTKDQQSVIDTRNKNMLVSAAAGSGKTAVLVERIIQKILDADHPVDIDSLLVVTFTNAAAAGMKEKISKAIAGRLELEPENEHLQKQAVLVHQAQITTIHSFCLYLIRNHFEEIGIEPNFTIADEPTMRVLSKQVKDALLENLFAKAEKGFLEMVEFICYQGKEKVLETYIEQLYERAMSMPFPKAWLLERKEDYIFSSLEEYTKTPAGAFIEQHLMHLLEAYKDAYEAILKVAFEPDGPYMYCDVLEDEKEALEKMIQLHNMEQVGSYLANMKFARLPAKKDDSVNAIKKEWVKNQRSAFKKDIEALGKHFFAKNPQSIAQENIVCKAVMDELIDTTIAYMEAFAVAKRKKNYIDFQDMEHMALEILYKESEEGFVITDTAKGYQALFTEVMVDEYQDSNLVQEYLVEAVSNSLEKKNRFMVGDVKQSIYKFRLARPEIFMEKYSAYAGLEEDTIRIDLKKNFRSRKEVLDATNSIFEKTMIPELGGISYDENAALYVGADYQSLHQGEKCYDQELMTECLIATDDMPEYYNKHQWEAYCVATRIKELLTEEILIDESTGGFRKPDYHDIVLLFRSPSTMFSAYQEVFADFGIPLYMSSGTGYFDANEVQNLLKFLQIIQNPLLDIPMYGVCISIFGGLTEEELACVKVYTRKNIKEKVSLYESLKQYVQDHMDDIEQSDSISSKITILCHRLEVYRECAVYTSVSELLRQILLDFQYREYMQVLPDGEKRLANVELLLEKAIQFANSNYHGLFAFVAYMNQMQKQAIDYGEANSLSEQADVVRVMSIHKSKGLEFPIVFVCGMGQNYMMKDKQQMILIDHDLGLGTDYLNVDKRSKNKTLRKHTIALKMEQEILAEEQRILYVAMTRAKEKLLMCGYDSKARKLQDEEEIKVRNKRGVCLLPQVLAVRSYMQLCLLAKDETTPIIWRLYTQADVAEEIMEHMEQDFDRKMQLQDLVAKVPVLEPQLMASYAEDMEFEYKYQAMKSLTHKTTVSELKAAVLLEQSEATQEMFESKHNLLETYVPDFMQEKESITGAFVGTAYHRVMELLDYTNLPNSMELLQSFMHFEVEKGRLQQKQKDVVNLEKVFDFINHTMCARIQRSAKKGNFYKERSFFLGVDASELVKEAPSGERVLVQGIIDAYWEEEDGIVLLDYKTDALRREEDFVERYSMQLQYYKTAIERTTSKKVKEIYMYSFYISKWIALIL